MPIGRNTSGQALVITKPGGRVLQLMPGQAIRLSEADIQLEQVHALLQKGMLQIEKSITQPAAKEPGDEKKEVKRGEAEGTKGHRTGHRS